MSVCVMKGMTKSNQGQSRRAKKRNKANTTPSLTLTKDVFGCLELISKIKKLKVSYF